MDLIKLIENYSKILKLSQEINNIELIQYSNNAISYITGEINNQIKNKIEEANKKEDTSEKVEASE